MPKPSYLPGRMVTRQLSEVYDPDLDGALGRVGIEEAILVTDLNANYRRIFNLGTPQEAADAIRRDTLDAHRTQTPIDHPDNSIPDSKIVSVSRSKVSDFFSTPFWPSIPDKPSTFPPSSHDKSAHTSPVLPDNDTHKTSIPIDHPDGSITNDKIADGTIDLTKKCTYVPVNKAGDTMTGDLVIEKDTPGLFLKGPDPYLQIEDGQSLSIWSGGEELIETSREGTEIRTPFSCLNYASFVGDVFPAASGVSLGRPDARWNKIHGYSIYSDDISTRNLLLSGLTSDPVLSPGLLWFRYDLGRLRYSPDGLAVKEFVHRNGDTMTGDLNAMNIYPNAHATYNLGKINVRWNNIYGVNIYGTLILVGDLGFSEDTCPLCGKEFQVGDEVVLKVVSKEGGIKTRPCHKSCPP